MHDHIDLASFKEAADHFSPKSIILTVKSFDLQAIRARYLASRSRNTSGRTGSVERRKPGVGGVLQLDLIDGQVRDQRILCRIKEPRAIAWDGRRFAFGAEDVVYIFDKEKQYKLEHPWFSYIHTVAFSPWDPSRILIASSGLDMIMEWDYLEEEITFEWLAWEHGFNQAMDPDTGQPVLLTRSPVEAAGWKKSGLSYTLITDPQNEHLPTAQRAAFINSVTYDPDRPHLILATFFHEGKVYTIDRNTGRASAVLDELKNPHGGTRFKESYMATSTGSGEVVLGNMDNQVRYGFHQLPGKAEGLDDMEWIQNSIPVAEGFLSIDSNRNAFIQFDPEQEVRCSIGYNDNWAVQDMVTGKLPAWIRKELKQLDDPPDQLK